ncbi:hypothetical protein NQ318_004343 [Aromia moschata]|uniref:Carbonic anhydrase n=1 Tax=Aromia moschata TaxID=1265417 RepID=A0AAV8YTQ3_9CUCU|nr:hypothetical protein NQ318_004343 [Aromia moschata]
MAVDWGYSRVNGPDTWQSHFPDCQGERQSPIDINPIDIKTLHGNRKLEWRYIPENIEELVNPGYCWKVHVKGEGSETHPDLPPLNQGTISKIEAQYREMGHARKVPSKRQAVVDDDTKLNLLLALEENPITPARQLARDSNLNHKTMGKYELEQFHCHWGETDDQGSEHTINGTKFAGELHLVHWNTTKYHSFEEAAKHPDGLCVIGLLIKPGKKHHEIDKIVAQLKNIEYKGQSTKISIPLNPANFFPYDTSYYTYQGSLTTPPCSECVIWIVFKEPMEISHDQLAAFRTIKSYCRQDVCPGDEFDGCVKTNCRPTVPIGKREVKECRQ